jgi:hypothetical protein
MRPRRSEGRRTVSPPSATASYPTVRAAWLQLAVTDHHLPLQALVAGGSEACAHPVKPAISLTKPIDRRLAPLL